MRLTVEQVKARLNEIENLRPRLVEGLGLSPELALKVLNNAFARDEWDRIHDDRTAERWALRRELLAYETELFARESREESKK